MPRLIARFDYMRNENKEHKKNYIHYLGTRENVEIIIGQNDDILPATTEQKKMIMDLYAENKSIKNMPEYEEYLRTQTKKSAWIFIQRALERNSTLSDQKRNYIEYLAKRPGAEQMGAHGLFSYSDEKVDLEKVMEEVANYPGIIYMNVISLRREDAEILGFDNAKSWQNFLRSITPAISENYRIPIQNLNWYAAFHNESYHPHVQMVVYSKKPGEGYLSKQAISNLKHIYANTLFKDELSQIYKSKTEKRQLLKKTASRQMIRLLSRMQKGYLENEVITEKMKKLSDNLMQSKGKKVYGYLSSVNKKLVNEIVDELQKNRKVSDCYQQWLKECEKVVNMYQDGPIESRKLSEQKELKSIRNKVVQLAVAYGSGKVFQDDYDWIDSFHELKHARKLMQEGKYREIDYGKISKVLKEVEEHAEEGVGVSAYEAGMIYLEGSFAEVDLKKSIHYLELAANQNLKSAIYQLGKIYLKGDNEIRDEEKAFAYFERAAALGHEQAAFFVELKQSGKWKSYSEKNYEPDLVLMGTRIMRELEHLMQDALGLGKELPVVAEIDSKLMCKIKAKMIAQGHAKDEKPKRTQQIQM